MEESECTCVEGVCSCSPKDFTEHNRSKHKHVGDECIHEDGTRHKIHKYQK